VLPARKRRAGRATEKGGLRRPPLAGALACRRSTTVLTSGTFVPKAQRRARLPEKGAKAAACRTHRFRSQRCTSRAGRIAGRHDARAARVRSVSLRPRAPHSLRLQGVPSPKASFRARFAEHNTQNGDACQWKSDAAGAGTKAETKPLSLIYAVFSGCLWHFLQLKVML
jgi:hypothetical protein